MRIVVLSPSNAWHYLDLKRAGAGRHEIVHASFETISGGIAVAQPFSLNADCVIVRIMPSGSLQQIIFRMDLLGQLAASGTLVLNSPRAIEIAVDKYLSLARLHSAGIPVPETRVSQDVESAVRDFEWMGGAVVTKPLFGSMGNGLIKLESLEAAIVCFESLVERGEVIYQQAFVEHGGFDVRLLVIGDRVLGMKRVNGSHWITNISQGGVGESYQPSDAEAELAIAAAHAVGAEFAGVDLVRDVRTDRTMVLEVNAAPGWRGISQVLGLDVAAMMLDQVERVAQTT
ncbi:MAG: RimK family alpha-L-glutamate ligase [Mariniblastus sp.]|jgi:RimK family alpha-L-glutamate ligase